MKKRQQNQGDTIPACYYENGQLIVPEEHEDYYVRVWKWKESRGFKVEAYKLRYLREYEARAGKITQWRDHTGNLRPL